MARMPFQPMSFEEKIRKTFPELADLQPTA
jgi:hypothetical protein